MIEISQNTQTRLSDVRELTKILKLKLSKLTFDLQHVKTERLLFEWKFETINVPLLWKIFIVYYKK